MKGTVTNSAAIETVELALLCEALVEAILPLSLQVDGVGEHKPGVYVH
jgi:hypothetical protein